MCVCACVLQLHPLSVWLSSKPAISTSGTKGDTLMRESKHLANTANRLNQHRIHLSDLTQTSASLFSLVSHLGPKPHLTENQTFYSKFKFTMAMVRPFSYYLTLIVTPVRIYVTSQLYHDYIMCIMI